jgi:hypothetical protein
MRCVDCQREGQSYLQSETTGHRAVCELCFKVRLILKGWLRAAETIEEQNEKYQRLLALTRG